MLDYTKYMMRHGESWVQEIVERIERNEGIRYQGCVSLEQRWEIVMQDNRSDAAQLAA